MYMLQPKQNSVQFLIRNLDNTKAEQIFLIKSAELPPEANSRNTFSMIFGHPFRVSITPPSLKLKKHIIFSLLLVSSNISVNFLVKNDVIYSGQ